MTEASKGRQVLVYVVLIAAYLCASASWLTGSLLTGSIVAEYGLTGVPAMIQNSISIAKAVGTLVGATFLIKLGPKKAVIVSLVLCSVVCLGAIPTGFAYYITTRLIYGLGGALILVTLSPYVMNCFPAEKRALPFGLNSVAPTLSNILVFLSIGPVQQWLGSWEYVLLFYGSLNVICLVLWLFIGKDFDLSSGGAGTQADPNVKVYGYKDILKDSFIYKYVFTYTGFFVLYIVTVYLFPLNPTLAIDANTLSLSLCFGCLLGTCLGIVLAKRVKRDLTVIRACGVLGTLLYAVMLFVPSPALALASAFVVGFMIFVPAPIYTALPSKIPGMTAQGVGVIMACFWGATYLIQIVVYAVIVWICNSIGWDIAMYVTLAYSCTYFIGSFILPDFSKKKDEASN